MEKEKLKKEIELYLLYYYEIKKKFDLYKYIKQNSEVYHEETKNIAYFLHTILRSLLENALMDISKIVDERNNKNVYKLLNICKQNIKLFYEDNERQKRNILKRFYEMKKQIDSKKNIIENLKIYRDKYLAHIDKQYFFDANKLFKEYKTSYEDIETTLNVIVNVCNELLSKLCNITYVFNEEYKNNYKYILECIRESKENRRNKYRKCE